MKVLSASTILTLCCLLQVFCGTSASLLQPMRFDIEIPNFLPVVPTAFQYICSPPGGSGPKELYYAPANRCYREGQRGPCKANQTLYEGQIPGHGICDCAPKLGLIYSSYDDECYIQNVQGPCRQGNWWVLDDNGVPMCQPVPRGCPADGRHVFWRISIGEERRCYRLGQRGPCTAPQTVTREIEDGSLDVSCAYSEENQFGLISRHLGTTPYIGCPRGSRRSIRGYCRPVW